MRLFYWRYIINCNENEAENEKYIKKIWHKDLSLHMDLNILKYKMHLSIIMFIYILSNTYPHLKFNSSKKLRNTDAELKKSVAYKRACIFANHFSDLKVWYMRYFTTSLLVNSELIVKQVISEIGRDTHNFSLRFHFEMLFIRIYIQTNLGTGRFLIYLVVKLFFKMVLKINIYIRWSSPTILLRKCEKR